MDASDPSRHSWSKWPPTCLRVPKRTELALRFTERWIVAHGDGIDGELLLAMREHYTDSEIVELAFIVGRYDMAHRFNVAFGIERPQDELYSFGDPKLSERLEGALDGLRAARRERAEREG